MPPAFEPLTRDLLKNHIIPVQNHFLQKLGSSDDPVVEDEDLPVKQRAPKPRLPPNGKISTPRKRPMQSQGGSSKKKKKPNPPEKKTTVAPMMRTMSKMSDGDVDGGNVGMISPESIVAGA